MRKLLKISLILLLLSCSNTKDRYKGTVDRIHIVCHGPIKRDFESYKQEDFYIDYYLPIPKTQNGDLENANVILLGAARLCDTDRMKMYNPTNLKNAIIEEAQLYRVRGIALYLFRDEPEEYFKDNLAFAKRGHIIIENEHISYTYSIDSSTRFVFLEQGK